MITTVTTVEQAYYDLIFAQENVKVQQKALELANRLVTENKKRVEVGALARAGAMTSKRNLYREVERRAGMDALPPGIARVYRGDMSS